MLSEKQQIWGIWLSAKNLTHSKSMGILDYIKCRYSKTAFGKNWNLACRVILSIYTFYVIFKQIWAWHRSRPSYLKCPQFTKVAGLDAIGIILGLSHNTGDGLYIRCQKSSVLLTNHWLNMRRTCYFASITVCWAGSKCGDFTMLYIETTIHKSSQIPESRVIIPLLIFQQIFLVLFLFPISKRSQLHKHKEVVLANVIFIKMILFSSAYYINT